MNDKDEDRDIGWERYEARYKASEKIRLEERSKEHVLELDFYKTWRIKNPVTDWKPSIYQDSVNDKIRTRSTGVKEPGLSRR